MLEFHAPRGKEYYRVVIFRDVSHLNSCCFKMGRKKIDRRPNRSSQARKSVHRRFCFKHRFLLSALNNTYRFSDFFSTPERRNSAATHRERISDTWDAAIVFCETPRRLDVEWYNTPSSRGGEYLFNTQTRILQLVNVKSKTASELDHAVNGPIRDVPNILSYHTC